MFHDLALARTLDESALIIDLFAGGGGASQAIFQATGRHPDIAINHDPDAIGVHAANHPHTLHYTCDIREVDPVEACTIDGKLRRVGLLHASPDCRGFSRAAGAAKRDKRVRFLMAVVIDWAREVRPRIISLENVADVIQDGPVLADGTACRDRAGTHFQAWVQALRDQGYKVEWRLVNAADHGVPTTRTRLFLIARLDGEPIRWAAATHAPRHKLTEPKYRGLRPWRAAADIIDWDEPTPSIFDRPRDLKPKSKARIAKGIKRYVVEAAEPFIIPVTHTADRSRAVHPSELPLPTITSAKGGEFALTAPTIMPLTHASEHGRVYDPLDPLRTVTAAPRGELALTSATLVARYGERDQQAPRVRDLREPYPTVVPTGNGGDLSTVTLQAAHIARQFGSTVSGRDAHEPAPTVMTDGNGGKTGVVVSSMIQHNGVRVGRPVTDPVTTLTNRSTQQNLMSAVIDKYYGTGVAADPTDPLDTATAKGRFGLAAAFLEQANTGMVGHSAASPLSTIVGKGCTQRLIAAGLAPANDDFATHRRCQVLDFLWTHFGEPDDRDWADPTGTLQSRLRFGLVLIGGVVWQITDVGMRMLKPRELFSAQGFPIDYIIDTTADGRSITKTAQTRLAGNSVCPGALEALLRENLTWMDLPERLAA